MIDYIRGWLLWLAGHFSGINWGMSAETFEMFTGWYFALGGAACTADLDQIHQGRYVVLMVLNIVYMAAGGDGPLFATCEVVPS